MAYKRTPSVQTAQEMSLHVEQSCSFYLNLNREDIGHYRFSQIVFFSKGVKEKRLIRFFGKTIQSACIFLRSCYIFVAASLSFVVLDSEKR